MIQLVPNWINANKEFWNSLKRRNLFFIKLRFIAVAMLIAFNYLYEYVIDIELTTFQHNAIGIVTLLLLIYNLLLLLIRKRVKNVRGSFNPLHLSLLQILVDLTILTFLIILTGGIESPLYLFYIFHLIIGSLILPGIVIYSIAFVTIFAMSLISYLQYYAIIPHYSLKGIYGVHLFNNPEYVVTSIIFFSLMMLISVFIANRIANQLYSQERKLVEALNEINSAELKKQKYIMGVVHEIKSPIAATKSIISLITEGFLGEVSPKVKEKLDRAIIRTTESIDMINNILRISRLRLLDEKTSEDVDVYEIVEEVLDETSEIFQSKKINLVKENPENRRFIKGDRLLLKLALSNLIGNAVKYTLKNGTVKIECKYGKELLRISICDSGIGIPKSEIDKIFENYYRAKNISQDNHEGSGVGLSLVQEIIKQHRGSVIVKSPSGIGTSEHPGTCFIIELPYELHEIEKEKENFLSVKGGV